MSKHFQVVVRCKPCSEEKGWQINFQENTLECSGDNVPSEPLSFSGVFGESMPHAELYQQAIAPLVTSLLDGNHTGVAVIAYGGTKRGKSHTVFGTTGQTRMKEEARGVVYRCGQQLLNELHREPFSLFDVSVSFCQLFEDGRVSDLFDTKKRNLSVILDQSTQQYSIPNLTQQTVTSSQDVLRLIEKGYLMRNATGCVREPARKVDFSSTLKPLPLQAYRPHLSHAIFTFTVEYRMHESDKIRIVKATIVDLAGRSIDEICSQTPCSDQGIETLQNVISTLSREGIMATSSLFAKSSLTKLLKPCFGGNCDTVMIGNISLGDISTNSCCLKLLFEAQRIKNFSKKTILSLSQSKLGQSLGQVEITHSMKTENLSPFSGAQFVENTQGFQTKLVTKQTTLQKEVRQPAATLQPGGLVSMVRPKGTKPPFPVTSDEDNRSLGTTSLELSPSKMAHVNVLRKQPNYHPFTTRGLTYNHPLNYAKSASSEQSRDEIEDSSESSLSLDSDESVDLLPTPVTTGPPPPPLRGIPHFNPISPLSSQLTSLPLIPSSLNSRPSSASTQLPVSGSRVTSSHPENVSGLSPKKANLLHPSNLIVASKEIVNGMKSVEKESTSQSPSPNGDIHFLEKHTATNQEALVAVKVNRVLFPEKTMAQNINSPSGGTESGLNHTASTVQAELPPGRNHVNHSLMTPHSRSQLPKLTQVLPNPRSPPAHIPSAVLLQPLPQPSVTSPLPVASVQNPQTSFQEPVSPASLNTTTNGRDLHSVEQVYIPPNQSQQYNQENFVNLHSAGKEYQGNISDTSSSLTISSDSEEELSDEARDHFNPTMQQRVIQMHFTHRQVLTGSQGDHTAQLPILPPTSPPLDGLSTSFLLPSIADPATSDSHQCTLAPMEHPPSYTERSTGRVSAPSPLSRRIPLPVYNASTRRPSSSYSRDRSSSESPEGGVVDSAQYMSSDEIHVAALEGVRASELKRLAIQFGVDYKDHGGRTPLMYAVLGNQPKMCETLIKMKASIDVKDSTALNPLLWATYLARAEVMKVLLKSGGDVYCTDSDGRSVYHWAMKTPNIQCLKWLCKYANFPTLFNKPDDEGLTPLHWAVMANQVSHVRLFLTSTNADVSVQDRESRLPLNYAVLNFSPACIRAILECREYAVNLTDNKGRTALHYACAEGSADCVRTLLSFRSCNLHCTDNSGTTPLHWAAAANQPSLVQLLLRRGADRGQRDDNNMSPLEHSQQRGHSDCVKILQTYGLRRPGSALSIASHVSIPSHAGQASSVDEQGHVILRRPNRSFSFSGPSMDRLPADGQAGSEGRREEDKEKDEQETDRLASLTHLEGDGVSQTAVGNHGHTLSSTPVTINQLQNSQAAAASIVRSRWRTVLCCGGQRSNAVAPIS